MAPAVLGILPRRLFAQANVSCTGPLSAGILGSLFIWSPRRWLDRSDVIRLIPVLPAYTGRKTPPRPEGMVLDTFQSYVLQKENGCMTEHGRGLTFGNVSDI